MQKKTCSIGANYKTKRKMCKHYAFMAFNIRYMRTHNATNLQKNFEVHGLWCDEQNCNNKKIQNFKLEFNRNIHNSTQLWAQICIF